MPSLLRVTELDFNQIKTNLKTFLSSQSEFTDYDFEGSGLNVLLDVLAYNTHYNAMLAHLKANETFLESANKRSSVVSIAKMLGYTPRSSVSSKIKVNITVVPVSNAQTLVLNKNTSFTGTLNSKTYNFVPSDTYTATRQNTVQYPTGVFIFENVTLVQGFSVENNFLATVDKLSGPFIIPNDTIDISTLKVAVIQSSTNITTTNFIKADNLTNITSTSSVFWVEENSDGKYQIIFGDDILGKKLTLGNIVNISYISTLGSEANGVSTITNLNDIGGESNISVQIVNNLKSSGGSLKETVDEIKFNAPKYNAARNRAVTVQDYKALILSQFSGAKNVAVWGGEENDPPIYGKIFITVTPENNVVITDADKDYISEVILRPRSIVSTKYEFVDPEYIYLGFDIKINFNPKITIKSPEEIKALTISKIESYFNYNLRNLEKTFIYSDFVNSLTEILPESVINGVLVKVKIQRRVQIEKGIPSSLRLNFLTSITPGSFKSNRYQTTITNINFPAQLQDFPTGLVSNDSTSGIIKIIDPTRSTILVNNVGTINYVTGEVTLNNIFVTGFYGNEAMLYFNAVPQELTKNIEPRQIRISNTSSSAIVARPSRNTIIDLDNSSLNEQAGILPGLVINVLPLISDT